ncbi:MAG TPA: divalent-cation tolerance protein CutA [Bryobacteraceae bacterium]
MTDKIVILSTCETEADARRIATHLVERRLAACVNIMPGATSVYRWKGSIEAAQECILIIKSRRDLMGNIEEEFRTIHPYEVPELIALPIAAGSEAYLNWLAAEL